MVIVCFKFSTSSEVSSLLKELFLLPKFSYLLASKFHNMLFLKISALFVVMSPFLFLTFFS